MAPVATMIRRTKAEIDQMVAQIESWDLSRVRERLLVKELVPVDLLDETIGEYRRFMMLRAMGYKGLGMISPLVDEAWHAHILDTAGPSGYVSFGEQIFGDYVHHVPNLPSSPQNDGSSDKFVAAYERHFGPLPDLWRRGRDGLVLAKECRDECNCSGSCKQYCTSSCRD